MLKSIRLRLLLWYAGMLLVVIAGFATYLYWSAERTIRQQLDVRLEGAVRYLDAALRPFPMRELLRTPLTMPYSPGMGRDGMSKDGPPRDGMFRPEDKRPNDKRGLDGDRRPPPDGDRRPPPDYDKRADGDRRPPDGDRRLFDFDRRPPMFPRKEAERNRQDLAVRSSTDAEEGREPVFFTIYRADGSIFKAFDDPVGNREHQVLESRLGTSSDPVYYESASSRLALFRGPDRSLILAGISMRAELARLDTLLYQLVASGSGALLLGLLGSWFISGRINRPLQAISTTASNLSATHLKDRIDTQTIDAELVDVASVLNDTFDRLESAFARQSRFTADAGHELRTPLAVLHANLELALSRPRSSEEYQETLKSCLTSSSRMRSLVDALLMLSRADAGQLQANMRPIDLRQLIDAAIEQHQDQAGSIHLEAKLPEEPVKVKGDNTLLGMVLTNLIANALRHTPENGHITVAVTSVDQKAQLTVSDDGEGIPLEAQPHIFDRFYRVDQSRSSQTGGYGLGLAICKSLVEAHQGTITFTSTPDEGTSFTITLPLASS